MAKKITKKTGRKKSNPKIKLPNTPAETPPSSTLAATGAQPVENLPNPSAPMRPTLEARREAARRNRELVDKARKAPTDFQADAKVCILFADLAGSLNYKHHHGPLRGLTKTFEHNLCAQKAIEDAGGIAAKFLGDGVLGYFEGDEADAARKGIEAGLQILHLIENRNAELKWHYPHAMSTKIGIHFGDVWMFEVGPFNQLDPHGENVDIASRLCAMACDMQLVTTKETYELAGGNSVFPNRSEPQLRHLKGIPDPRNLISVERKGKEAQRIPPLGYIPPLAEAERKALDQALRPWTDHGIDGTKSALENLRELLEENKYDFHANFRLAQLLVWYYPPGEPAGERDRLNEAFKAACTAKVERPQSCYVWKLLSWIKYRFFCLNSGETKYINEAIEYANESLLKAESQMDEIGAAVAKVYLIIFLNTRIRYGLGDGARDLRLAQQYASDNDRLVDKSRSWFESFIATGKAMTRINLGVTSENMKAVEELLEVGRKDKLNKLVHDVRGWF